jgi:hypothetical protein
VSEKKLNRAKKMYELKEILTQQNIELPTSMYKMKPINITASADNETSSDSVIY